VNCKIKKILDYLQSQKGFDFSGYRRSTLERRINKRMLATETGNINEYCKYLMNNQAEVDKLIDALTINVSQFFRNPLVFEYISEKLMPRMIFGKLKKKEKYLRIWSAGCAAGEEPYSLAIIFNEFLEKENLELNLRIFATDIDKQSLKSAKEGVYNFESIKEVKYGLLSKYFIQENSSFKIVSKIKNMVNFSFYDLLEKNSHAPPESIFGNFDLIFCRNVLIYFNLEYQDKIFKKLHYSLTPSGYLILGEAEMVSRRYKRYFSGLSEYLKIFQKL